MTPEQWQQVKQLFHGATELPAAERSSFLRKRCKADAELLQEVERLLESHAETEDFIERSPLIPASTLFPKVSEVAWAGRKIGHYRVLREIGRGGMGIVFLGVRADDQFEKRVAVKLLRRGMDSEDILQRFRNERQILASLEHPHIARLLDGGITDDGLPYFVMEYVEGEPLDKFCDAHRLTTSDRLKIFSKVCAAAQYAHQNLIVHRDLKPSNILVTPEGEPKLLDFGIAKLLNPELATYTISPTATMARLMTPDYASPEQIRGKTITTASDVYSLGVVLYRLLTGHAPYQFADSSPQEVERLVCEGELERPSTAVTRVKDLTTGEGVSRITPEVVSSARQEQPEGLRRRLRGDLDNIVLKAMRKEPERRYLSAAQLAEDIGRYLAGLPVSARKDTFAYRASKFIGRNKVGAAAAVVVLVTLLTGVGMTVREKRKADRRFNDVRQMANSLIFEVDDEIQKGPTRARAALVKRALEYLDSLAQEGGNDSGLQLELAAGYLKVGDIQGKPYRPNLGDTAGALVSYRKAQVMLEALTAAAPANLEARRYLSLSYQSVGRMQGRSGDWNTAFESVSNAVSASESLVSTNPSNPQFRSLLADNYLHLGEVLYQPDRGATIAGQHQAIEYFRKALAIHAALAEAYPSKAEYRYALAVDYEFVGIAFNNLGDLTGDAENYRTSLENHLKELEINQALAASDPTNASYRRIIADAYGEVGLSQLKLNRTTQAVQNLHHRLQIFQSIEASDPTNVEARRDVANSHYDIGRALEQAGALSEGLAEERKAIAILEALHEAEPTNTATRSTLLDSYGVSGEIQKKMGDYAKALESYRQALALLESWTSADPASVPAKRLLAIGFANIARVHETAAADNSRLSSDRRQAEWRAAQEWYRRSLSVWEELRASKRLNEADASKLTELTKAVAKCDAALSPS